MKHARLELKPKEQTTSKPADAKHQRVGAQLIKEMFFLNYKINSNLYSLKRDYQNCSLAFYKFLVDLKCHLNISVLC
jgi:hypothetical protein